MNEQAVSSESNDQIHSLSPFMHRPRIPAVLLSDHEVDLVFVELDGDRRFFLSFLSSRVCTCSPRTRRVSGGMLFIRKTLAPIVLLAPMTVSPPRMIPFGYMTTSSSTFGCRLVPLMISPFFILLETAGAKGDAMVEFHPVTDDAGFPDDHTGSVVDEEVGADSGLRDVYRSRCGCVPTPSSCGERVVSLRDRAGAPRAGWRWPQVQE